MSILPIATSILSLTYLAKGIKYILGIRQSIGFFSDSRLNYHPKKLYEKLEKDGPQIIILLPLLREQAVVKELLDYFLSIPYPRLKIQIILITTEKENKEKAKRRVKVKSLFNDLSRGKSLFEIKGKHLGLFPGNVLENIYFKFKKHPLSFQELKTYYNNYPTTFDLTKRIIAHLPESKRQQVYLIHYPKTKGVMAHQLNYGVRYIKKFMVRNEGSKVYVGVYNADSKPNKNTFMVLGKSALDVKTESGSFPEVFQQISAYCHNYFEYPNTFQGWFLKASSIVQTRWGLGSEIPMLIRQSSFWGKKRKKINLIEKIFEPPAYCVGHGMFVRLDILQKVGLFPTETLNEDLALGYYLTLNKIPIRPIPALENVENPDTISMLITQKASWFWGMIDYLDYYKYVRLKVKDNDKLRTLLTTTKGLMRDGLSWLLGSIILFIFLFMVLLSLQANLYIGLFAILSLIIYVALPSFYLVSLLPSIFKLSSGEDVKPQKLDRVLVPLFSYFYLLSASMGPWRTFIRKINSIVGEEVLEKNKTER